MYPRALLISIVFAYYVAALSIDPSSFNCPFAGTRPAWAWFGGVGNDSNTGGPGFLRPQSREHACSWSSGSKFYVLGGRDKKTALTDFWQFDTSTYRWRLLDRNVSESVGVLQNAFTTSNSTHLFLYGGFNQSGEYTAMNLLQTVSIASLEQLNDGDSPWQLLHPSQAIADAQDILVTPIEAMLPQESWFNAKNISFSPGPRWAGASWIVGDTFYVFGGVFKLVGGPTMADLWQWNVQSNDGWTLIAGSVLPNDAAESGSYPSARFGCMSWTVGNQLWLYGGQDANGVSLGDIWRFDTTSRVWTRVAIQSPTGPFPRSSAITFQSPGRLWIYGGNSNPTFDLDDMHYFDVMHSHWVTVIAQSENDTQLIPEYGVQGAPTDVGAPISTPAARTGSSGFVFNTGNSSEPQFWLFGGSSTFNKYWNDVWAFKCYSTAPCGPFPFSNRPELVGECTSHGWVVLFPPLPPAPLPGDTSPPATVAPSPSINITVPVVISGNASVQTNETLVIVQRTIITNFTAVEVKDCSSFDFGNVTLDISGFNGTQLTLLSGACFNYSITGLQVQSSNPCIRATGHTLRDTNHLVVLLDRKTLCKKRSISLIVGAACGGVALLAGVFLVSLFFMRRKQWPRWLWHSSIENKKSADGSSIELQTTYRT